MYNSVRVKIEFPTEEDLAIFQAHLDEVKLAVYVVRGTAILLSYCLADTIGVWTRQNESSVEFEYLVIVGENGVKEGTFTQSDHDLLDKALEVENGL